MNAALDVNALAVNPARAGMILVITFPACANEGKPRASGDDPTDVATQTSAVIVNPARAGMIL